MADMFYSGQRLSAADLNALVQMILNRLNVGQGLTKTRVGNQINIGLAGPKAPINPSADGYWQAYSGD